MSRTLNRPPLAGRATGTTLLGLTVVLPDGRCHAFSQFGAGTFAGAATYLGEQTIINLSAMQKEAEHLREMTGEDPFLKLLVLMRWTTPAPGSDVP